MLPCVKQVSITFYTMKKLLFICLILFFNGLFSQDFSSSWKGHFSFNKIIDISQGDNLIYAASENVVFSYNTQTSEFKEITTINGLSGGSISSIYYSSAHELLMIGYENGLIEIVFDDNSDILTIIDIENQLTISDADKRINHFNEYNSSVYISTGYGISVYDLNKLEFGDTYFIGDLGSHLNVRQTTIISDKIYAACQGDSGIKVASLSNPKLIDYSQWSPLINEGFLAIEKVGNNLYSLNSENKIFQILNELLTEINSYDPDIPINDFRNSNEKLVITLENKVLVYDENYTLSHEIPVPRSFSAVVDDKYAYIGTENYGVLKVELTNISNVTKVHPQGPLSNKPFSIKAENNNLWVTYGDYTLTFNAYPLKNYGFSHLKNKQWINVNVPFKNISTKTYNLNTIIPDPFSSNKVYITSFFNGLLEVDNDIPTTLYDNSNSGLESLSTDFQDIRVGPAAFDSNGLLWTVTSKIDHPLKSFNPSTNEWQSYDFTDLIKDGLYDEDGFSSLVIDKEGNKWVGSSRNGLIAIKADSSPTPGKPIIKNITESENMPSTYVSTLAVDKNEQLWIGTLSGLRVLYNPSDFFNNGSNDVDSIIIEENGLGEELLFQQFITSIKVDGSNNKWIGTVDAGVFCFSPDGQKTLYHFTVDNSPLPSNNIRQIAIDDSSGEIHFATNNGLVSFFFGSTEPSTSINNAFIYPNPVRPNFDPVSNKIKIKGLSENVNVKITDIEGNLVAEAQSKKTQRFKGFNLEIDGGSAFWNSKNMANNVVASGVYLVMISDLDNLETNVLKLLIVR